METTIPRYLHAVPSGTLRGSDDGRKRAVAMNRRMLCAVPEGFHTGTRASSFNDDDFDALFEDLDCEGANTGEVHRVARCIES